jgi:hypothetical protein
MKAFALSDNEMLEEVFIFKIKGGETLCLTSSYKSMNWTKQVTDTSFKLT